MLPHVSFRCYSYLSTFVKKSIIKKFPPLGFNPKWEKFFSWFLILYLLISVLVSSKGLIFSLVIINFTIKNGASGRNHVGAYIALSSFIPIIYWLLLRGRWGKSDGRDGNRDGYCRLSGIGSWGIALWEHSALEKQEEYYCQQNYNQ